jgi:regulator of sigma E protease
VSIVLAILSLSLLVIVHEGGHFIVARLSRMRVERFSLGFGPALLKKRIGGTQIQIAPILIGGFVHIVGMNPHEDFDEADPQVYPNRPTWQRFLTILAGPLTNILLASFLIFFVYACAGVPDSPYYQVEAIGQGHPPAEGVLEPGDRVVAIDGVPITVDSSFQGWVQDRKGASVLVSVVRHGKVATFKLQPRREPDGRYMIGVQLGRARRPMGTGTAVVEAVKYPALTSVMIVSSIVQAIKKKEKLETKSVVGMTDIISQQIKEGWVAAFEFLAVLSVYLGLFNLVPFPALDGGRLAFLGYELVTRRRPNPKVEAAVHMAGFLVLLMVIILVMFKDIRGLFS